MTAYRVAFVCSGNRFRSPLAEHFLRRRLDDIPVEIESFGTLDLGSMPPLPEAVAAASESGIDLTRHRSRPLHHADLSETDLVVGFERAHVVAAVVDGRADRAQTFTLPEVVELLGRTRRVSGGDPAAAARTRIRDANAARPHDPMLLDVPEIPDPLRRTPAEQQRIASEVADLVDRLADLLFPRR